MLDILEDPMGIMGVITVVILVAAGVKLWQQSREEKEKRS
jgi:predicted histidine transporter YuiF (NhaC family)